MSHITGGRYMSLGIDHSENVRMCMRLNEKEENMRAKYDKDKSKSFSLSLALTPYANRSTNGFVGAGPFLPQKTAGIPSYCSMQDPCLEGYFTRKFSRLLSPQLPLRDIYYSSQDADKLGLRSQRVKSSDYLLQKSDALYKVAVTTADVKGAGTSVAVYISIRGDKANLQRTKLKKTTRSNKKVIPFKFSPGSTQIFAIKCPDLGELESLLIEHDGLEPKDSWLLQGVEIMNTNNKKIWLFACNHWLSLYKEDGKVSRELFAFKSIRTKYEIIVITGDVPDAETDSQVYITLCGRTGSSPQLHLQKENSSCFQKGQSSRFIIPATCVGPITKIRVRQDESGSKPNWFLDRICITDLKHPQWRYFFQCKNWLSSSLGDGALIREIRGTKEITGLATRTEYKISFYTANKPGSGTKADVFLQIFGEFGESDIINVKSPEGFQEGSIYEHVIPMKQLGTLKEIRVGHNNKGPQPRWLLDKVIINDIEMSRVFEFPCGLWFSNTEGEQLIRVLKVKKSDGEKQKYKYEMKVTTGNRSKANTSSKVYVILSGPEPKDKIRDKIESSGRIWLQGAEFSKGRTDVVVVELGQILSPLTQLFAGISPAGNRPDWFLEDIIVFCPKTGIEQSYICGNWISASKEGCTEEVLLVEDLSKRKMKESKDSWIINVHTSDMKEAGTSTVVTMVLYGNEGKTDDIVLNPEMKLEHNSVHEFRVDLLKVGVPYKLRVQHDNTGYNPSWHLDKIVMTHVPTGDIYQFKCNRWLSDAHEDKSIVREIPASGPGIKKEAPVCKYNIQIYTGNKMYAGTDANVFINVYGDLGDFGDRFVTHTNNQNKFEKNQMDEFTMGAVKLGKIKKIKLGHDSKLPGSGWFVDKVIVCEEGDQSNCITFRCNCWFDSKEGEGLTVREITGFAILGKVMYDVIVKTGTKSGAGTDANIYLRIFGTTGDTGKVQLKTSSSSKNKFENGATDVFKLEAEDFGEIKSIRLSHDDEGAASAWLVDQITIFVPKLGLKYVFLLNKWLDKNMLEINCDPTKVEKIDITIPYQVTIFTGNVNNAGTNAKVFLQIYGKDNKTEEMVLESRSNIFERGNEDLFKINAVDVGTIQKIRIGHDGKGPGAGWFLDKVLIEKISKPKEIKKNKKSSVYSLNTKSRKSYTEREEESDFTDDNLPVSLKSTSDKNKSDDETVESYWFFANSWLAIDEGDGMIVRELLATDKNGNPLSDLQEFEYKVSVKTGNESGAGTDANVFLTIYGKKSDSGERALKKTINQTINKFEQNSLDTFNVKAIELGPLEKIKIRHDNYGGGAAWYLEYVLINDNYNEYFFPCYSWLSKNMGDGLITRDIFIANPEIHNEWKNGQLSQDKFKIFQEDQLEKYEVNVYTTKRAFSGTDANVYLILFGDSNDSGIIPLKKSLTYSNKFESGNCDKFIVKSSGIGKLKKIKIGHDNSGGGADWHLEKVEVEALKLGETWVFPCNEWISKSKGDGKLERELYPQSQLTLFKRPRVTYEITTHTSSISGAGTSAEVYIQIYGRNDCTEKRPLANESDRSDKFKKGSVDTFYLEMEDVEDPIEKIRIGHNDKGLSAGWHLNQVIVKRLMTDKSKSVAYKFSCNRWLSRNEDDRAIERELIPDQIIRKEFSTKEGRTIESVADNISLLQMKKYIIRIYTGDETGTNANVFLKVFGENGDTGERQLTNSKTNRDKFERNKMDEFDWEAVDLGPLQKIDIRHDNSGLLKKDWFLKKVEIIDTYDNETYIFQCERWLSKSKEDKKIKRTIYAKGFEGERSPSSGSRSKSFKSGSIGSFDSSNGDAKSGTYSFENDEDSVDINAEMIPYTITIKTGPEKNMGSSGPIWVKFYGMKELKTRKIRLQKIGSDCFEPDSKDTISVEAVDVQNIRQIEVANEGVDKKSSWYLSSITVEMPTKGKSYHVQCSSWLSKFYGDRTTSRIFNVVDKMTSTFAPKVIYELTIYTGDCDQAGTNSSLFIQLFGSRGASAIYPLEKEEDNFERDHIDKIKLEMEDIGVIKKIRVQNDGKGIRPHWFLEKIEITNVKTMDVDVFIFKDYLSNNLGQSKLLTVDLASDTNIKKSSYTILVKTSNKKSANTSAGVFIKLYGEFGDSGELALNKPAKAGKIFQIDQLDEFLYADIVSLGDLNRCQVWHNNNGFSASWHLEYIEVREINTRKVWKFQCNKWLSQSEEDKQIFRELICDSSSELGKKQQKDTVYEVTVTTGDKKNAGMPDDVWLIFHGSKDFSGDCLMENSTKNKLFSKGNVDQIKYKSPFLGDLKEIMIGAVNNKKSDVHRTRWYCHEIQVKDLTTLKTYTFEVRAWIDVNERIDKKQGKLIEPSKVEEDAIKMKSAEIRKKGVVKYEVSVFTGKLFGSGTNANIFLTIYGENMDSGKRPLVQKGRDLFEKGQEDKFILESADLGEISKVKIEHDDTGLRSDWFLDRIQIMNMSNNKIWRFECGEWLSKEKNLWKIINAN